MLAIHVGLVLLFRYDIFKIQLCNFETVLQFTKPKCEEYSLKKNGNMYKTREFSSTASCLVAFLCSGFIWSGVYVGQY